MSKAVRDRLAEDDAEIADLENRLGLRGRRRSKNLDKDGLGEILGDAGEQKHEEGRERETGKRKAEYDEWLARKRCKPVAADQADDMEEEGEFDGLSAEDEHDLEHASSEDDEDDFSGNEASVLLKSTVRENPYVAPVVGSAVTYIPPAARQSSQPDNEISTRIRRQVQGWMNRLNDTNLVAMVKNAEELYRDNPRHHVTAILVDLLLARVCEATALLDKYLILFAGFATALNRIVGVEFGAKLLQQLVDRFARHSEADSSPNSTKETVNIVGFLSQLYVFQLTGATIVFDYIRHLLQNLTERNAELLLRILRTCGTSLRQDDPLALKDIAALARPASGSMENLSVRTRFMMETIRDLKSNKTKAGVDMASNAEQITRVKRALASLGSSKLKTVASLQIGLKDIQQAGEKGKWWLVGASWTGHGPEENDRGAQTDRIGRGKPGFEQVERLQTGADEDAVPDLWRLAREQKLNTVTQQSIFVAILSANDFEDAYSRIQKLRLNKARRGEIPTVIIQCVGAEASYNAFYGLVASKLCSADRKIKYSFQDSLWKFFRRLGQPIFDDDAEDIAGDDEVDIRRIVNVARLFGFMVVRGALGLSILRCLDMPYLKANTKMFVEAMLVTVLLEAGVDRPEKSGRGPALAKIFKVDAVELAPGLLWFLRKVVRHTDLAGDGDKTFKSSLSTAEKALEGVANAVDDGQMSGLDIEET